MEEDFLSIKEFADKIHVHPNTVRRALKNGKLNGFKLSNGKRAVYRIPVSEMNRLALVNMEEMIEKIIQKRENNRNGIVD